MRQLCNMTIMRYDIYAIWQLCNMTVMQYDSYAMRQLCNESVMQNDLLTSVESNHLSHPCLPITCNHWAVPRSGQINVINEWAVYC